MPLSATRTDYVLLTGATGFLGQFLLRELRRLHRPVAVLVRPSKGTPARDRVAQLLARFTDESDASSVPPVVVLQGDVVSEGLGLSQHSRDWVRRNCSAFMHNAAAVSFSPAERQQEPWLTNLGGTENVLKFCRQLSIPELHHISTAYVCGTRQGLILETDLACGQTFRNPYEESKFEAEQLVAACDAIPFKSIYRPSIITGDSKTGYTCSYHGMMWYLRLFDLLIPKQPRNAEGRFQTDIVLPFAGDQPHDVVTVDWVAETVVQLMSMPQVRDKVIHLTASQPTTIRDVVEYCCEYYGSEGVQYAGDMTERLPTSEFSDLVFRMAAAYHGYEQTAPQFDRTNLESLVPNAVSPPIDRELVIRLIECGRRDSWGKQSQRPAAMGPAKGRANPFVEVVG